MKILKILLLLAVLITAAFTGWHYYMKATWDHHLVGVVYVLDNQIDMKSIDGGEQRKLSKEEFLELAQKNNIDIQIVNTDTGDYKVFKVKIVYSNGEYRWVSNGNKKLTKRLEHDGKWDFYIYETENKSEFIKIRYNGFEVDGCNARPHSYMWGMELQRVLKDKTILLAKGNADFYQNPIQYFLCPDLSASQKHTILTRIFY